MFLPRGAIGWSDDVIVAFSGHTHLLSCNYHRAYRSKVLSIYICHVNVPFVINVVFLTEGHMVENFLFTLF